MKEPYTFDDAWYNLGGPSALAGEDDDVRRSYANVLVRLPARVRAFALDRCVVLTIGRGTFGMVWPASIIDRRRKRWIIVIDAAYDGDMESGIAHELAHAWLGHNRVAIDVPKDCEAAADAQIEEWGFSKVYGDAPP